MARTRAKPANAKPMAKSADAGARTVEPSAGTANAKPMAESTTITGTNSRLATASSKHGRTVYWRTTCNTATIRTISAMGTKSTNAAASARQLSTSTNATKTT